MFKKLSVEQKSCVQNPIYIFSKKISVYFKWSTKYALVDSCHYKSAIKLQFHCHVHKMLDLGSLNQFEWVWQQTKKLTLADGGRGEGEGQN